MVDTIGASILAESMPFPTITIETARARIAVTMFAVGSETRQSSDDPWKKEAWKIRKEDEEFREWATEKLMAILQPALRGLLERGEISQDLDWEQVNSLLKNDNGQPQTLDATIHQPAEPAQQDM